MKALLTTLFLLFLHVAAVAQWNPSPSVNMLLVPHDNYYNRLRGIYVVPPPPVERAQGAKDQFLVVWSSEKPFDPKSRYALNAHLLNLDGSRAWGSTGRTLIDTSTKWFGSEILISSTGRIFLNFYRNNNFPIGRYNRLCMQQFDRDGTSLWNDGGEDYGWVENTTRFLTADSLAEDYNRPLSTELNENSFCAIYRYDVLYDHQQNPFYGATTFLIRTFDSSANFSPRIPVLGTGYEMQLFYINFAKNLACYPDDNRGGVYFFFHADLALYMQHIDLNLTPRWPWDDTYKIRWNPGGKRVFGLASANPLSRHCVVSRDSEGFFFVAAWKQMQEKLVVQRIDTAGNCLWQNDGIPILLPTQPSTTTGNASPLAVVTGTDGSAIVVARTRNKEMAFRAQRIDKHGNELWSNNGERGIIIHPGGRSEQFPAVLSDGNNGIFVVYSERDVFVTHIDSSGSRRWDPPVRIAAGSMLYDYDPIPMAVSDGEGGIIVVWQDWRSRGAASGYCDIYATRIGPDGVAFPIELGSFTAQLAGTQVRLDWQTESETDNAGFEIERAISSPKHTNVPSAAVDWQRIGYRAGHGSSKERHAYVYYDELSADLLTRHELLYRLRQINYDGSSDYSPVARVMLNTPTTVSLEAIYPHPAREYAVLRFSLPTESHGQLAVYDRLGRKVTLVHNGTLPAGIHERRIALTSLTPGLYHVVLTTGNERLMRSMLVVR